MSSSPLEPLLWTQVVSFEALEISPQGGEGNWARCMHRGNDTGKKVEQQLFIPVRQSDFLIYLSSLCVTYSYIQKASN